MKTFFLSPGAVVLVALVFVQPVQGQGQDFDRIAPKQPAKTSDGQVVDKTAKPMVGHTDGEVLVDRLQGVFMISSPKEIEKGGVTSHRVIEPGDVAMAERPDFESAIDPYIGKPVTMKSLAELTRSIVAFYREHDRPVVNVYVPGQSITSGFVQIVVVETKVEKVDATGAHYFSNSMLRDEVRLRPAEPISGNQMREDLAWINRNPFLQSDILMAPGDAPGTTDVLLRTQDRFPVRAYAGYEDSGNQFTGRDRLLYGFNYGNLFGVGQQLSYQFMMAPTLHDFYAHSGTYVIPLPWRHMLTFFGSYSAANSDLGSGFASGGVNWQVSARYEIPLPGTSQFTESLIGGFDFKRSNNDLVFGGASVFSVFTDVDQFVVGYQASYSDDFGSTSASATGFLSPGGLTSDNNDAYYAATRAGARADYMYAQYTLNRITRLPMDFTWSVRGEIQHADANLIPSEQLGVGGYESVRGYEEREANGDNGFLLSNEIATPPVSVFDAIGLSKVKDQLQFLAFVDYGGTSLHQLTPADVNPDTNLLGVGPGVRYVINPYLSVRFDYGFQLINTGYGTGEHSRGHVGVVLSY
jgi:hemolysin activation/secretion protein